MAINERPGVYTSVEVSGVSTGSTKGRTVGIAGVSAKGTLGECVHIGSYGEALSVFGECSLTQLIRLLLKNGASSIEAVAAAINTEATGEDYENAFAVLMEKESVTLMLCDSRDAKVHNSMRLAIAGATEACKYRIGVVETAGTVSEAVEAAAALNCERMVMVYPALSGEEYVCGGTAAAFAGALSIGGDPALPLSGQELAGLDGFERIFSDAEIASLIRGGVTPIESVGGKVCVVRGVTSRTTTGGEADATWRELTTVLIVDDVIPSVRSALRAKFPRVKNNAQTRGAIRTQVIIELESKLRQEIIDGYGEVTALPSEEDPCVCEVSFEFSVTHGLNRINLAAHISV